MAMSDTGSSFTQWASLYNHHHEAHAVVLPDDAAALDVGVGVGINGTTAAAASPTSGVSSGGSPTKHQQQALHGVEGPRIGKPAATAARRRSRASRRAPVTLLNTDTANFRAMVQQFTGIPTPPAGAFGVGGVPVINFAADYGFPPVSSSSAVMSFDHHNQLHRSQQLHAAPATLQEQLRRQQQYTGASSASQFGYGNGLLQQLQGGGGDVFASHGGFAASSAEDRMLLQSIQAAQMPHMPPVTAAANTTSTNGFFA